MNLSEIAEASEAIAATSSRTEKRDLAADLLRRCPPDAVEAVVGFLTGEIRQGRIGIGHRTIADALDGLAPATRSTLEVLEVDSLLTELAVTTGVGSAGRRRELLVDLFERTTASEARLLVGLLTGELRQGALAGVITDAVARAAEVPATVLRRAVMFDGRLDRIARLALTEGRPALERIRLRVGRPVQPMIAVTAETVAEAVGDLGRSAVEWKIDGIRIQVHRDGDEVGIHTRNLNDITARLPEIAAHARALPARRFVLDGEALLVDETGRPALFQDTASRIGSESLIEPATDPIGDPGVAPRPFYFDLLHLDDEDLTDRPFAERRDLLGGLVGDLRVPGEITEEPLRAEEILAEALTAGHEGVMVKAAASRYEAGRRGRAWRKVKPVHTLDLVVIGVEWGHGRRHGWLSNLHLGALATAPAESDEAHGDRDPTGLEDGADRFVMVGKTFKGLTDRLLRWQTERFLQLAVDFEHGPDARHGTVVVRPEQVVEIALDGVQRSTRYPGGVALRFARVVRYRDDKSPSEADTIDTVSALLRG